MRILYLDEAGISNPKHEPFVVVSGIILDGDKQWKALEQRLIELADGHAPEGTRDDFIFHATEIYSGGKRFPRDKFDREFRWKILDDLVAIPKEFELPIMLGFQERKTAYPGKDLSTDERTSACLQSAFLLCLIEAEKFLREYAEHNEVAMVVMEESKPALHRAYRELHKFLLDENNLQDVPDYEKNYLPLTKIVDTPHFAGKTDSSPLQVADTCAFMIKRHLMHVAESRRFYAPLKPNLISYPRSDDLIFEPGLKGV